jgi:hypothetical protein
MTVNIHLSDLFFNMDHSNAKRFPPGEPIEMNEDVLLENAKDMLGWLNQLGLAPLPTREELVRDFYARW